MSLRGAFDTAAAERRAALVAYLTFGDPDPATSIDIVEAAARAGADVIELGVPFSDPSADGPSIQRAMERALVAGATLAGALEAVAELRRRGIATPIVLFGYYNPMFVMGPDAFAARAAAAGVDAVLTVDLPIDELAELATPLAAHGVGVIPLVAPTSTPERIARLAPFRAPFVYYISLTGVTGVRAAAPVDPARLEIIRQAASAPVAVGFGIRTPQDAAPFARIADGVVVGTALVDRVAAGSPAGAAERVASLIRELAAAMKR
ncbi:MAG: tryptophan synthase subunit alpha [Deltaproteobacteria bacterium]|nr:tryptophan synthase subunit alpha [Deltaproteobacteria bacterium]